MTAKPAVEATVETTRNLLRTRYTGRVSAADMQWARSHVTGLLAELKPGFSILADWSQLESLEQEGAAHLAAIMDLCGDHGVDLIVRILPDATRDIGINILSLIHYRGKAVRILTCDTLEEAERAIS